MTKEEIFQKLRGIISNDVKCEEEDITLESSGSLKNFVPACRQRQGLRFCLEKIKHSYVVIGDW